MIIGHQKIISYLEKAADCGRLPHGLIFEGPKNIGKTAAARYLAAKLLNVDESRLETHPDFFYTVSDGKIGKEQIDGIIQKLQFTSFGGGCKIALVEDAHLLTVSAANAFLKTLEEPAGKSVIILLTSELTKILPTVRSRSAIMHFKPVAQSEVAAHLRERGANNAKILSSVSYGRPGRALKLLADGEWQKSGRTAIREFCNLFFGAPAERLRISAGIFAVKKESGKDLVSRRVDFWLELLRDIIFIKYGLNDNVAHSYEYALLERAAESRPVRQFSSLAARLIKMRELMRGNINAQLLLENLII